ncbi:MAG: glycosyltransferase family 4 protein [Planctomycetes bacterium]|nr:glycosyltransferase family 4 protein [Planctomycetota bacterium]NUQ34137.1 glycosyltransferase family 4 protein [Planctomycetaceae bacterium]
MRIAITNDAHFNGGAVALMAWRFTRALIDAGHDATLITGQTDDALPNDIPVEPWRYPERKGDSPLALIRFYQKLRGNSGEAFGRWYSKGKADLWVALVIPSALGALDGGGRRVPLLYCCNSPWAMEWLAAWRAQNGGAEPQGLSRMLGVYPRRRAEREVVTRAKGWMALSQLQLDWFSAEHGDTRAIPKTVVPGAVDCSRHVPLTVEQWAVVRARYGIKEGERLLVCSRRLVPRTGVDLLLDALKLLGSEVKLVVTGDGPSRETLDVRSREIGLANRVTFTGFLQPDELRAVTASADLAVLPTRELEGFGLAAAEAMSCGTPVVSTSVGSLVDVVGGLDRTLLADAVSAESLAAAIKRGLSRAGDEHFRASCREYASKSFDWNVHKAAFVKLCETLSR